MRWEACFDCGRFDSRVCASLALAPAVRDAVTCLLCMYNTAEGVGLVTRDAISCMLAGSLKSANPDCRTALSQKPL